MTYPTDFTFNRHPLSKWFPDTHDKTYVESRRIGITGSGTYTSEYDFTFSAFLRKVSIVSSGSVDGDFFHLSGSNRTDPYALNVFIPNNGLGLVLPLEKGEIFKGGNNSLFLTYIPTGSSTYSILVYWHFLRD